MKTRLSMWNGVGETPNLRRKRLSMTTKQINALLKSAARQPRHSDHPPFPSSFPAAAGKARRNCVALSATQRHTRPNLLTTQPSSHCVPFPEYAFLQVAHTGQGHNFNHTGFVTVASNAPKTWGEHSKLPKDEYWNVKRDKSVPKPVKRSMDKVKELVLLAEKNPKQLQKHNGGAQAERLATVCTI